MPTFYRKKKPLKPPRKRRTFKKAVKKTDESVVAKEVKSEELKAVNSQPVQNEPLRGLPPATTVSVDTIPVDDEVGVEVESINRMISSASSRLREMALDSKTDEGMMRDEPDVFDGISNEAERMHLVEEKLKTEQKKAMRMQHEMELMKAEFEKDKGRLEEYIRTMRKEMRGTQPLDETHFFSLSKELKTAVDAIAQLTEMSVNTDQRDTPVEVVEEVGVDEPVTSEKPKMVTRIHADEQRKKEERKEVEKEASEVAQNPKHKKKKMLITGGAVLVGLLFVSGAVTISMVSKPQVNETLVEEYLKKAGETGEVAGASSGEQAGQINTPKPAADQASDEVLNRIVQYEETQWEEFDDPMFGIRMKYPINSVRITKTDSSATFSRREGYIFRIQLVETGLDLKTYWEQIRATGYDYQIEEVEFNGKEALHLMLDEVTDFPGNRYLVKVEDTIFDIWYATASEKFSKDDIMRVEEMLRTISFVSI